MDYMSIKSTYKADKDYSQRSYDIAMFRRVLEGKLYDNLKHAFYRNFNDSGGQLDPIPLNKRRPSVRYRLAKIVVDDSVGFVFGEGRFPMVTLGDGQEEADKLVQDFIKETTLNLTMIEVATSGSVGSGAVLFKLIEGRCYFECLHTEYLTAKFDPKKPDCLLEVKQKYKVSGEDLELEGYENLDPKEIYWFMRKWDTVSEKYFTPWKVSDTSKKEQDAQIDDDRTIIHNLGFVPIVWIKNLPGGPNRIDGECTFEAAIDTNIELDYQLSQCGRGLKYSSEPLLMIKNPAMSMSGEIVLGEGNVINVDVDGDAKHVEIDGKAASAVMEYAKILREIALENIHGNRTDPDKFNSNQSGVAMKMLFMALISLADKLRITYGDNGLKKIIYMLFQMNQENEIIICNKIIKKGTLNLNLQIELKWPDWFPLTPDDRLKESGSLTNLVDGGLLSRKTAVGSLQSEYDIVDLDQEVGTIMNEIAERESMQTKSKEILNA